MPSIQSSHAVEIAAAPRFQTSDAPTFAGQLERVLSGELSASVHFQPIVDLRSGAVAGYEALARFPREVGLPPNVWLERAAFLGRRIDLEHLLCETALAARAQLPANCFLTINAGPDYLVSSRFQELLNAACDLSGVVVEITEETSISSYAALRSVIAGLRSIGGSVAVDDAGAGYASLHHILEIKPDFIKLDRHFIQNCDLDRAKSALIEMMGGAANRLDAWVIAEGIETAPELEELIRLGVPLVQGYLLGRPQAHMRPLDASLAGAIRSRNRESSERSALLQEVSSCPVFSTRETAASALAASADARMAIVVDAWRRPTGIFYRHSLLGTRWLGTFMRAQVDSEPAEVLQRALTRDEALRFDPIVVVGSEGESLGIVDVDRLVASVVGRQVHARSTSVL